MTEIPRAVWLRILRSDPDKKKLHVSVEVGQGKPSAEVRRYGGGGSSSGISNGRRDQRMKESKRDHSVYCEAPTEAMWKSQMDFLRDLVRAAVVVNVDKSESGSREGGRVSRKSEERHLSTRFSFVVGQCRCSCRNEPSERLWHAWRVARAGLWGFVADRTRVVMDVCEIVERVPGGRVEVRTCVFW